MTDFEDKRKKRLESLEEKRKRLEELKKNRTQKSGLNTTMVETFSEEAKAETVKQETDKLVDELMSAEVQVPVTKKPAKKKDTRHLPPEERSKEFIRTKCNFDINFSPSDKLIYDKESQVEIEDKLFGDPENNDLDRIPSSSRRKSKLDDEVVKDLKVEEKKNDPKSKIMSNDLSKKMLSKPEFKSFLSSAARHFEKALKETDSCDVVRDYAKKSELKKKSKTFNLQTPFEEDSFHNRPVMDIVWGETNESLDTFLVAYGEPSKHEKYSSTNSRGDEIADSPGLVAVWNRECSSKCERLFLASSAVTSTILHPTDKNIIIAGCYSGQILEFDQSQTSHHAFQRSNMSGKGHKHPVYAMSFLGNNSNEMISVSTDGLLCTWDITRLNDPLTNILLNYPSPQAYLPGYMDLGDSDSKGPLNVCSMAFEKAQTENNILFGTGSGQLFRSSLPYRTTNPPINEITAHRGLVSSIQPHCSRRQAFKSLLLTSSLDWTVKLWSLSKMDKPLIEISTPSFEYVCDVQWSPGNPAIFCMITPRGNLSLWNISTSTSTAFDTINILGKEDQDLKSTNNQHLPKKHSGALNKVTWSKDGLSMLIGDSTGKVHLVTINKSQVEASAEEMKKFEALVASYLK